MKPKLLISTLAMLIFLSGCGNNPSDTSGSGEQSAVSAALQSTERIVLPDLTGYTRTTLTKLADLTVYKTDEQVHSMVTAPVCTLDGGNLYLLRNVPDELEGEALLEWWNGDRWEEPRVIEVYTDFADLSEPELIRLDSPEHQDCNYIYLSRNPDGTFSTAALLPDGDGEYVLRPMKYSESGELISIGSGEYSLAQQAVLWDDSMIYLDIPVSTGENPAPLIRYWPETEETVTLAEDVLCFTLQGKTLYWIAESMDESFERIYGLYRCDADGGSPVMLAEVPPNPYQSGDGMTVFMWMHPQSMGFDEVNNVLYYTDFGGLRAFSLTSGETVDVMDGGEVLDMEDNRMLVRHGINQISVYTTPGLPDSVAAAGTVLRAASVGGYGETSDLLLAMERNGFPLKIENVLEIDRASGDAYGEYANTMAKKLLAGDDDFDLFWLSTETPTLFKEGYFWDLGQYPLLRSYYDRMPEGLAELCSVGDVPALYPLHLYTTDLAVYSGLAGENFTPPETFTEFTAFTDSIRVPGRLNLMNVTHIRSAADPWLNQLISNFMAFRGTEENAQEELTMLLTWALEQFEKSEPGKESVIRAVTGSAGRDYTGFPLPKLNEAYGTPYTGYFLAVNPNSPNRDLAALYLAYKLEDALADGVQLMDSRENFTGIRAYPISAYAMTVYELMEACAAGDMTPSDAAAQILREMKMMRDE